MSFRRAVRLGIAGTVAGLLGVLAFAGAASAHDWIIAADPADGATVGALSQVALTFSGDLIGGAGADIIEVVGPDKRFYETACADLAGPQLSVPVVLGPAGQYEVAWRAVSSDGHPVSGTYTFTYAPDASSTAGPSTAGSAKPACGEAAPAPTAAPSAAAPPDLGVWLGLGIGIAAVAVAAVGAWLIARRPRASD
jgi:methionine-rich copper-binding protein CopC